MGWTGGGEIGEGRGVERAMVGEGWMDGRSFEQMQRDQPATVKSTGTYSVLEQLQMERGSI